MKPATPVVKGYEQFEKTYAKDQPEYIPLPSICLADGTVITRWELTWRERLTLLVKGNLYLTILTFNKPLQPVLLEVEPPNLAVVEPESS